MLAIGTAAAVLGIATLGAGIRLHRPDLLRLGRRYVFVVLLAAVGAFAVMEWAMFSHDFSIAYVADNLARATPGLYTFTAVWSALEGSILLWALALVGLRRLHHVAVPEARRRSARRVGDPRAARRARVLLRAHAVPGQSVPASSTA